MAYSNEEDGIAYAIIVDLIKIKFFIWRIVIIDFLAAYSHFLYVQYFLFMIFSKERVVFYFI